MRAMPLPKSPAPSLRPCRNPSSPPRAFPRFSRRSRGSQTPRTRRSRRATSTVLWARYLRSTRRSTNGRRTRWIRMSRIAPAKRCGATSFASATWLAAVPPIRATSSALWWIGFSTSVCRCAAQVSTRSRTNCAMRSWMPVSKSTTRLRAPPGISLQRRWTDWPSRSGGRLTLRFRVERHLARASEPVSLARSHAKRRETIRCRLVLDTFGDDRRSRAARVCDSCLDDGARAAFNAALRDALGDLQIFRHCAGKQFQCRMAFADVVERELESMLSIAREDEAKPPLISDRLALGDLEDDRPRVALRPAREQQHVVDRVQGIEEHRR